MSWPGWLVTYQDGLPTSRQVTHPSTNTNWAQCRATSLTKTNKPPVRHAATMIYDLTGIHQILISFTE